MTKIVRADEMSRIEKLSYQAGCSEESFMRAAGLRIAGAVQRMVAEFHLEPKILFLCGKGNNGGDGYASATYLAKGDFSVQVYALSTLSESSPLSQKMRKEYIEGGGQITEISSSGKWDFSGVSLIVDALWGTGFKGELPPLYDQLIAEVNQSKIPILAIDIPSGINGNDGTMGKNAIRAWKTCFLGLPKRGCFLGKAFDHIGEIAIYDFGLEERYIAQAKADFILIEEGLAKTLLPPLERSRHKYQAGYLIGVAGSPSMPGAALLASEAALHVGAGMVRLFYPEGMEVGQSLLTPEVIRQSYKEEEVEPIIEAAVRARAFFIGPGMGTRESMHRILVKLLSAIELPLVIDGDGLTLIARHTIPIPKGAILTPHVGEMKRLLEVEGKELEIEEMLTLAKKFAETHLITLVLKGAPTYIFHPGEIPYLMARGDAGMATAGSGDVLTGLIAGLLAQKKSPLEAAILGTFLHGLSGEIAAKEKTSYAMIASDITRHLPQAFKTLL